MRAELGEFFHHLMQEASRLHLKWNEYEALFNAGREKVENMNRAAPGFFWITQNALWHDIILSLCRIADNGSKVLSVKRLPGMTKFALRDKLNALLKKLEDAAEPARKARDHYIAHLDFQVVPEARGSDTDCDDVARSRTTSCFWAFQLGAPRRSSQPWDKASTL